MVRGGLHPTGHKAQQVAGQRVLTANDPALAACRAGCAGIKCDKFGYQRRGVEKEGCVVPAKCGQQTTTEMVSNHDELQDGRRNSIQNSLQQRDGLPGLWHSVGSWLAYKVPAGNGEAVGLQPAAWQSGQGGGLGFDVP